MRLLERSSFLMGGFLFGIVVCWNIKASIDRQDVWEIKDIMRRVQTDAAISKHETSRSIDKTEECFQKLKEFEYQITGIIAKTCERDVVDVRNTPGK